MIIAGEMWMPETVDRPATLLAILAALIVLSSCVDASAFVARRVAALVAARRGRWSSIPKAKR